MSLYLDRIEHTDAAVWTYGRQAKQRHRVESCTQIEKGAVQRTPCPVLSLSDHRAIRQQPADPIVWEGTTQPSFQKAR